MSAPANDFQSDSTAVSSRFSTRLALRYRDVRSSDSHDEGAAKMSSAFAVRRLTIHRLAALTASGALLLTLVTGAHSAGGASAARPRGTIVFAGKRSGNFEIYSVRADGTRLGQLTRNRVSDTAPVFSPDGRRIVFTRSYNNNCCFHSLWLMNADGSRQRQLVSYGDQAAWAPDSRRIAFTTSRASRGNSQPLVIANVDGGRRVVVRGTNYKPAWSPDGRWIAVSREKGDRTDVAIVRSDGRGLRTIRRNAGLVGWTASGLITFATDRGTYVVRLDRRGLRRVAPPGSFAWAPGGRQFALIDLKGRLRVGSMGARRIRNITPRGAGSIESPPTWSPDGRWIAVRSFPNGATYHDLLVVAANGASWRRISPRVPYPYGSESQDPSWRPRGATAARLGRPPVAALPSETVSRSALQSSGHIQTIAADGMRVAFIAGYDAGCAGVHVWEAARRRVVHLQRPCPPETGSLREGTFGPALAGTRAGWVHTGGGNFLETIALTATLNQKTPTALAWGSASEGGDGTVAGEPVGDGNLLVFTFDRRCTSDGDINGNPQAQCPPGRKTGDVVAATIWRVGGGERCPYQARGSGGCARVASADGELAALAVDGGRILARTDTGLRLFTETGAVVRDFPRKPTAAVLSGNRVALRTAGAIEVYDVESGQLATRLPVERDVRLEDLEGEILVTASGKTVTLRRLGDGRTAAVRTRGPAHAQLEAPGLYVSSGRRITFTPMADVLQRFGATLSIASATAPPRTIRLKGAVMALAMEGFRVAYEETYARTSCDKIFVLDLISGRRKAVAGCRPDHGQRELAVAGSRIAWIVTECGNSACDDYLATASRPRLKPRLLAHAHTDFDDAGYVGSFIGSLVGSRNLLAVNRFSLDETGAVTKPRLSMIGRSGLRRIASGPKTVFAQEANGGRIAVLREDGRIGVFAATGKLLAEVTPSSVKKNEEGDVLLLGDATALQGRELLVLTAEQTVEIYDLRSRALVRTWRVPKDAIYLDTYGGVAAYAEGRCCSRYKVHVLNLATGKDVVIDTAAAPSDTPNVQLEAAGLVYTKTFRSLVFLPMRRVLAAVS
jgi:dipeptidyl aminopeptidase/acylaminoacyl peptidase